MEINKDIINNLFLKLDLNKALSQRIWVIKNKKNKSLIRNGYFNVLKLFLRTIFECIFYTPVIKSAKGNCSKIFYIRTYSRKDLDEHSKYFENLKNTTTCIFAKKKFKFDPKLFLICIFVFFRSKETWKKVLFSNNIKYISIDGLKLLLNLFRYFSDILKIFPYLFIHKKVVSFLEMSPVENLICQIANIKKIETFGLEHAIGMYKEKGEYWERYAITHYQNSICKNILCWGDQSKNIYKKHTSSKIYVIGKASLPKLEILKQNGVTFIFQDKICVSANNQLLSFSNDIQKIGVPVSRWFKRQSHALIDTDRHRNGPLYNTVIGCSSNMLLELGFLGCYVYVIEESVLTNILPKNLVINNTETLIRKFQNQNTYPHEIWKKFIACTGNETLNRYSRIIT